MLKTAVKSDHAYRAKERLHVIPKNAADWELLTQNMSMTPKNAECLPTRLRGLDDAQNLCGLGMCPKLC